MTVHQHEFEPALLGFSITPASTEPLGLREFISIWTAKVRELRRSDLG